MNFVVFSLFLVLSVQFVLGDDENSPSINLYEIDSSNKIIKRFNDIKDNEVVLENVERVRLECVSPFPVQWIYIGNGIPNYVVMNTVMKGRLRSEPESVYKATILLNPLKEHHTGKYYCSGTETIDLGSRFHLYLYVPGPELFAAPKGKEIFIPKNDSRILIPCSVSNPAVAVSLEKSIGDVLQKLLAKSADGLTYSPRTGFILLISQFPDPEGTYVCTGRYKSLVNSIEYNLTFPSAYKVPISGQEFGDESAKPCRRICRSNEACQIMNGRETCVKEFKDEKSPDDDPNGGKCSTHTDCPSDMACYTDKLCRNPCGYSARCGADAKCRVEDRIPICYCPNDFVGDANKACFNTLQGAAAGAATTTTVGVTEGTPAPEPIKAPEPVKALPVPSVTNSRPCRSDSECGPTEHCRKTSQEASLQCLEACLFRKCGDNADCSTVAQRSTCTCRSGFTGNAYRKCYGTGETSTSSTSAPEEIRSSEASVSSSSTRRSRPRTRRPTEEKKCNGKECETESQIGDEGSKVGKDCTVDSDCGTELRCQTTATFRKCVDPCERVRCSSNHVCKGIEHKAVCSCPKGSTGNPEIGCTQNFDVNVFKKNPRIPID